MEPNEIREVGNFNGTRLDLRARYTDVRFIGQGSFGGVYSARDQMTSQRVAVKKLRHPFESSASAKNVYREITLLLHLQGGRSNENLNSIIPILDLFTPCKGPSSLTDIYLVMELAPTTLERLLDENGPMEEQYICLLVYRLTTGLHYLHSAGIIHRDLKPSNVAVWPNLQVKIIDLGSARTVADPERLQHNTPYVQTRWWRAPEVIVTPGHYDHRADMWSLGCVAAQCFNGAVLFPGRDQVGQIHLIVKKLGLPADAFMSRLDVTTQSLLKRLAKDEPQTINQLVPDASEVAVDFLSHLLVFDSLERYDSLEALRHPFFTMYHDTRYEPTCRHVDQAQLEGGEMPIDFWKERLYQLITDVQPELPILAHMTSVISDVVM